MHEQHGELKSDSIKTTKGIKYRIVTESNNEKLSEPVLIQRV